MRNPRKSFARANDEILVVVMAETAEAVANIDEILSVPGIDAVFIGPNDLHASLGVAPAFDSKDHLARRRAKAEGSQTHGPLSHDRSGTIRIIFPRGLRC